jgi:hypothetical protein
LFSLFEQRTQLVGRVDGFRASWWPRPKWKVKRLLRVWPSLFCEVYQCLKDKFQQATHHYREMKMLCIDSGFELRGVSCLPLQSSPMEMDKCDYSVIMYYVAAFLLVELLFFTIPLTVKSALSFSGDFRRN